MTQSDPQQFLERFFGEGNAIQWSQYAASLPTDAIRVSLEPWIVRFQQQQSPYCLPRVDSTSQQTSWYVLCTDSRQTRSVRESLPLLDARYGDAFHSPMGRVTSTQVVARFRNIISG